MSQPYVGEIRMFGGNFAPAGWAFCSGQLVAISENEVLFNLIGTTYGGDGVQTFGLPDLQGRLPIHMGTDPSTGTTFIIGEKSGTETVTLTTSQIPSHAHNAMGKSANGNQPGPGGGVWATSSLNQFATAAADTNLNVLAIANDGGNQPHENMMPFLCVSFIISLFGIFPSQN
jgi:microcystin-dependent protein